MGFDTGDKRRIRSRRKQPTTKSIQKIQNNTGCNVRELMAQPGTLCCQHPPEKFLGGYVARRRGRISGDVGRRRLVALQRREKGYSWQRCQDIPQRAAADLFEVRKSCLQLRSYQDGGCPREGTGIWHSALIL